jgi:hypothetical protein
MKRTQTALMKQERAKLGRVIGPRDPLGEEQPDGFADDDGFPYDEGLQHHGLPQQSNLKLSFELFESSALRQL